MIAKSRLGMVNRRQTLALASAAALAAALPTNAAAAALKLVFVHGRGQGGLNSDELKATWLSTLSEGAAAIDRQIPADLDVAFPFYGDVLDEFASQAALPLPSEVRTRGSAMEDEFLAFQAQVAEEVRQGAGVTDAQVDAEYGDNPKPRGPLNWEWVQAIIRAIDKHATGASQWSIEKFTRDVFLYTTRPAVRNAIDAIVEESLTDRPTVVVGHSLGSVVAYHVLRTNRKNLSVPLYVTVGCPLGIRAIRDQFRPLKFPLPVNAWYNAFDRRDVVALYPLDADNFAVTPPIENFDGVANQTDNRHGIIGYLNDKAVAERILTAIGT
jgi:hypothetical protein